MQKDTFYVFVMYDVHSLHGHGQNTSKIHLNW